VAEASEHRIGDIVGRSRLHRLGHAVGIARWLEDPAAHACHHQVIDAPAVRHGGGEGNVRAHGEAQQVSPLHARVVQEVEHVLGHRLAIVPRWIVRFGAFAMAAAVQGEAAQALSNDGIVPAHAFPVLAAIGREAMHQHDRLSPIGWAERVIGKREPIGRELSHNFP
jgi:hypothetical protein